MSALLNVILPVFVIIAIGYGAARFRVISEDGFDGIMGYAQSFAIPILLFKSIAAIDLSVAYNIGLMASFYGGAFSAFGFCLLIAKFGFRRAWPDSVAIAFTGYFSNTLLLGLPITENAYGAGALAGNFAIISIHAPLLYTFGISVMVLAQSDGSKGMIETGLKKILTQPLVIGIICGFAMNLSGLVMPQFTTTAIDMIARSGIPAALFGLGGVLFRYRPEGDAGLIATVCVAGLIVHPAIAYGLGRGVFQLDRDALRSATLTAAMAPGVNAYMFAHLFGVGKRVAASALLIGTGVSILTVWAWLHILP
jgi:malonate transporter and related proteins